MRSVSACYRLIIRLFTCFIIFLFFCTSAFSQQKKVTGKIISSSNSQPVVGATVTAKKSRVATVTGADGNFTMMVPSNETTLTVSFVGFQSEDVPINAQGGDISVSLKTSATDLNEVVVIGYGTQKRKDVTGAISSVTATQIEKVPVTTVDQALQGRAAGVQIVNNDASPGGNMSVLIRGIGSL